jgi:hypothetical protein
LMWKSLDSRGAIRKQTARLLRAVVAMEMWRRLPASATMIETSTISGHEVALVWGTRHDESNRP